MPSAPSRGAQPASGSLLPPSSLPSPPALPPIYPHTPLSHTAVPLTRVEPTHPSTPPPLHTAGPIQPSTPPLLPPSAAPSFLICQCGREQKSATTIYTSCAGADFTAVDRKKMRKEKEEKKRKNVYLNYKFDITMSTYLSSRRKGTTERHKRKQQDLRGMRVNIDCRWAPTGIAKLWASLPKQGVAMATISRRITRIIGEHKLQGITIKRRNSKNGYTTPYEIYDPQEVIKTLSDPGPGRKSAG